LPVTAKAAPATRPESPLRYLDVAVVVIAAVPALILGAPALGYILGAVGWIVQRIAQVGDRRLITRKVEDPVRRAGATMFESFGRIWLLAGAIIIAAVAGNHRDGLTAAIVIFAAYTVAFALRLQQGAENAAAAQEIKS
jgi:hypothetical protein